MRTLQLPHRSLYAAFDRFPSRKGAAIHIDQFARVLFGRMGGGLLYVVGGEDLPPYQREETVEIVRFSQTFPNFLERTIGFGRRLEGLLNETADTLELCHFRDPWSGVPILARPHRCRTVYEVNGLPSIELPSLYGPLPHRTLSKIERLEQYCLQEADVIITPSFSIRSSLAERGVKDSKITVIPNGATIPAPVDPPPDAPDQYILYFGALQPWQGVDTLFRAFALLRDLDLKLVLCASAPSRTLKGYRKLIQKLDLEDRVLWRFGLEEGDLASWRQHALLSTAPLTDCSRNVEQGCAPLKILESMASGTPVIASDLPSVREIMVDGEHGRLVYPERPGELARAIRILLQYPEHRVRMGENARRHIQNFFTWQRAANTLNDLYGTLL